MGATFELHGSWTSAFAKRVAIQNDVTSRFPAARAVLANAIEDHAFPGAAFGVLARGEVVAIESAGHFTYAADSAPVLPETVFDLASVSKVMATTAMAMLLWERGRLDLDEPIGERLPEFIHNLTAQNPRRGITARMLLAHSSGLPAYAPLFEHCASPGALLAACLRMPLEAPPESRTAYSDIGFIVLGHLLETLAGERLDEFCRREIFTPLEMKSTMYRPPPEVRHSIPPTARDDSFRHRLLQGEVHDGNCYVLGGVSGHAGLFSNVADTLRFARSILEDGAPIFRPETVDLFTAPHGTPSGPARALGWDIPSPPSSSGKFFSARSIGHLGYTGTSLWIDLDKKVAIALLTNRTFPGDGPDDPSKKIQQVRPRFHDAVLGELGMAPASGESPG